MFLRKRVVPQIPPSFVKLRSKLLSLTIGAWVSIPIRLHVPLLRYANPSFFAGTAATALAVSCPATATTLTGPIPVMRWTCGDNVPITSPGITISGIIVSSIPADARSSILILRLRTSRRPEVEAMVYSHTMRPVSIHASASGMNSRCFAALSALLFSLARA